MKQLLIVLTLIFAAPMLPAQTKLAYGDFDPPLAYASLPTASGVTGQQFRVTDCLTTACTAGGGSIQAKLFSNGTTWQLVSNNGGVSASGTLTSGKCVTGAGTTVVQVPSSVCGVDSSGNLTSLSVTTGDGTKSGSVYMQGTTSGGVAWAVADIAGTAIAYVLPATNGIASQVLVDTGAITCPTLDAGAPSTCHLLAWQYGALVPLTAGASVTLSGNSRVFVCTTTCTVTPPVPSAGLQYCVMNGDNVSTVITFSAIGSSARYENTARTAYGTAGTGTFISGGAAGDMVCILGLDSTHYLTPTFKGTWTAN